MIRTRWMAALRRQDWVAIGIELLTLVLGLFLGLRLNEWKEGHDARTREHKALTRLQRESEAIVEYLGLDLERMAAIHREQREQQAGL